MRDRDVDLPMSGDGGTRRRKADPLRKASGTARHATKASATVARLKARRVAGSSTSIRAARTDSGRRTTTACTMSACVGDPLMRAGTVNLVC